MSENRGCGAKQFTNIPGNFLVRTPQFKLTKEILLQNRNISASEGEIQKNKKR